MRTIAGIGGPAAASLNSAARRRSAAIAEAQAPPAAGTALIVVGHTARNGQPWSRAPRAVAAFIAQLVAADRLAPQTRARRRAEPEEAVAIYAAASAAPSPTGRVLRRSL